MVYRRGAHVPYAALTVIPLEVVRGCESLYLSHCISNIVFLCLYEGSCSAGRWNIAGRCVPLLAGAPALSEAEAAMAVAVAMAAETATTTKHLREQVAGIHAPKATSALHVFQILLLCRRTGVLVSERGRWDGRCITNPYISIHSFDSMHAFHACMHGCIHSFVYPLIRHIHPPSRSSTRPCQFIAPKNPPIYPSINPTYTTLLQPASLSTSSSLNLLNIPFS